MWDTLYHLVFYPLFLLTMRVVAIWSPKIRRGLKGRADWRGPVSRIPATPERVFRIHFHVASVGEFEQAIPLIEALRREDRAYRITVSFFSSSGYDLRKGFPQTDGVCYLPHDRQSDMNAFMNLLSPDLVIIIRYDLWPEFVRQTQLRGIPAVLINGVLRQNSVRFFPLVRTFFSALYGRLALIAAVEEEDREAFLNLAPDVPVLTMGDTRYDRVEARFRRGEFADEVELVRALAGGRLVLVAGSTWPEDERLLGEIAPSDALFTVIVPHEPTPDHISALCDMMPDARTLSQFLHPDTGETDGLPLRRLIVDRLGLLAELYRVGDMAWVGGGFGAGVHSLLEPAACGLPLMCGPKIERSRDALALQREGILEVVTGETALRNYIGRLIEDDRFRRECGEMAGAFVAERTGGTERILHLLRKERLLPDYEVVNEPKDELRSAT